MITRRKMLTTIATAAAAVPVAALPVIDADEQAVAS